MSFDFDVPISHGGSLEFSVEPSQLLFVLGANGTGKSSLMHRFFVPHQDLARKVVAHRTNWIKSSAVSVSHAERQSTQSNIKTWDSAPNSRWLDHASNQRASISLFDLVEAENHRSRKIAEAMDKGEVEVARNLAKDGGPIKTVNEILKLSNIPIQILSDKEEAIKASRAGGPPYSIAKLSDGERSAILLASDVLTANPGMLLIIDEPERHLHRSIISPLLTLLFSKRPDCAFIVSTHDVFLPLDNPKSRTLLVRDCTYTGDAAASWDADLMNSDAAISDDLKQDIWGGRRKLLFVEGDEHSLDKPLYSLLFPSVSVVAKQTCRDVEHSVAGIRDARDLHWVHPFGIIDSDNRSADEITSLQARSVFAVPAISVESIYYHLEVQRRIAARHAAVTGDDPEVQIEAGKAGALSSLGSHIQRLSERIAESAIRATMMQQLPRRQDIAAARPIDVRLDIPALVAEEVSRLTNLIGAGDFSEIIRRYPLRETPALGKIAFALGFTGTAQYEAAVRKALMDDEGLRQFIVSLFGDLSAHIGAA